ncbi:Hint domain-containing protein [Rhodobacter sp. Har01]|uniref:Hint domain-containing protein n=1 Tax=Rhodobacter sp. Har01 TaxID=2883999 RepID=UPI001D06E289|nr:Hint domain-containing protein [Rhodobacter sp. Har01]MCB6179513.1 Hint domain-containing protein [Rhodobacter sp. Har01]
MAIITGTTGNDTLSGTNSADLISGLAGNDSLYGGGGSDTLDGGLGADRLDGGSSSDTASYALSTAAVQVDLSTGSGTGGDAQGDTLVSIENLAGSGFDDILIGNGGNNRLTGGAGNDALYGGAGTDVLDGGDGNDTLVGGTGSDNLIGGAGTDTADYSAATQGVSVSLTTGRGTAGEANGDTLSGVENLTGSAFADTLVGDAGANVLNGGAGNDSLSGESGDDTLIGGAGADTLSGGEDLDIVDYSGSNAAVNVNLQSMSATGGHATGDVLSGVDGVVGSAFDDTLVGFDQFGTSGDVFTNVIRGGGGNDSIDGRAGNDSLYGDDGNDTILGGAGNDTLSGGDGNDSLVGGAGADLVDGGDGNDTLVAGDGDTVLGGDGDDLISVSGLASISGGAGSDTILGSVGSSIDGSEDGDEIDVLDLTGMGPLSISYEPGNPENGVVTFYNGLGQITGTMSFSNIETVVPCFTPGTRIACEGGERLVESLRPGDRVMTRDNGLQVLRWAGCKRLTRDELVADPRLQPVQIGAGALGDGLPLRDMRVSRQHRMLVTGARAELFFGSDEVLVRAEHLVGQPGIVNVVETEVTYVHLLFDRHEVVLSDGAWSESFQPGDRTLAGMDDDARDELFRLFPDIAAGADYPSARLTLKRFEAQVLLAA